MNYRPFMIMILAVLLIQPFVVAMSAPATILSGIPDSESTFATAQGSRLSPGEYTNHVPFTIDGTTDFVSQGWPGAGTIGDPYIIAGLNITTDVGLVCIEIINTNASFVIRDSLLDQNSVMAAIKLVNTTAGTIEYTTIFGSVIQSSDQGAIALNNANNTLVSHVLSTGRGDMGLYSLYSNHLSLMWSVFNSTDFRATRVDNSDYLTIDNSQFYNYDWNWWCTRFDHVNHTVITNSEMYTDGGVSGIAISDAYYSSISDTYIWAPGSDHGLNIDNSPNITVTRVTIELAGSGADIDNSPGLVFTDSVITDSSSHGVELGNSPNSTLSNLNITNSGNYGLWLISSDNTTVTNIGIDETNSYGLVSQTSSFVEFDGITVTNTGNSGFWIIASNNGTLKNSIVQYANGDGIYLDTAHNWTVTDNLVEYISDAGIYLSTGDNYMLTRNHVYDTDEGFIIDTSDNADIVDNHVTMGIGTGFTITTCDNVTFAGNTADETWDGASIDTGINVVIEGNIFTNLVGDGMRINDIQDSIIRANEISGSGYYGMQIDYLLTSTIEENTLTGFGFWFAPQRAYSYYNNTVVNNTVNGMDIYYARDIVGVDLVASDYAQFIIINGSHVDIHDGTFDHVTNPVMLILSDNSTVWDIGSTSNIQAGYVDRSDDTTIYNVHINGGGFGEGIFVRLSDHFNLTSSVIERCSGISTSGVYLWASDYAMITNCEFDLNHYGIYANDVNDFLVSENLFTNHDSRAISVVSSSSYYVRILNNDIFNATYGVYHEHADNVTISMNTIMYSAIWGIWVSGSSSSDVNITLNEVTNNANGITIRNNGNSFVMNNSVLWNAGFGIEANSIAAVDVYYNIIALNLGDNGHDDNFAGFWDDGSVLGNWWDDFTPPAPYAVDGNTDDRYPMQFLRTEPIINQPQDIYYAEGSEDNEVLWYAFDDSLGSWAVTIDGGAWASDAWNFDNITVNIDGLEYGTHTVVVTVWDIHGNNVTDTVIVHVFDDTAPVISNVPNLVAFVDATNQVLTWEVNDLHPDSFRVLVDDEEFATGSWTEGTLDFNIDGIDEGEHALIMQIADIDGNTASDTVLIRVVLDNDNPVIDSPDDITYVEGTIGNVIIWNPQDDYPATFQVFTNTSMIVEGSWGGSRIVLNVDDLSVGTYRFQITVIDGTGNAADDFVNVVVTPVVTDAPPPPPPLDLALIGIVVAGIAAIAVIIVVVIVFKKKKAY